METTNSILLNFCNNWKTVSDSKIVLFFQCCECDWVVPIEPEEFETDGAPDCYDCDRDMKFYSLEAIPPRSE